MQELSVPASALPRPASDNPGRPELALYASGEIASNLSWNMVTGFLLVYYTDVALIPAAQLGVLFLLTRLTDAVADIFIGLRVDRTRSRWGKARPYLLYGAVPFGLLSIAVFAVPDASVGMKVVYAWVTFLLLGLTYSAVYIPYAAMQPLISSRPTDQVLLGSWRSMGTSIASIIVYSLVQPLVGAAGGGAHGYLVTAIVFSVLSTALYLLVFRGTTERVALAPASATPARFSFGELFSNRIWVGTLALQFLTFVRLGLLVSALAYLARLAMHRFELLGTLLSLLSVAILAGGAIAAPMLRRFGILPANWIGIAITVAALIAMPFAESSPVGFAVLFVLSTVMIGVSNSSVFLSSTNAAELQARRTGRRNEGVIVSAVTISLKVGMALGMSLIAFVLAGVGYTPTSVGAHTVDAIRWAFYGGQVVLVLLQLVALPMLRPIEGGR